MLNEQRCQNIFKSFLAETDKQDTSPYTILHSFIFTEKCDQFHNLSEIRAEIKDKITTFGDKADKERINRFLACETNEKDDKIITTIVSEQRMWMYNNVYNGLNLKEKIWYHTTYRFDRLATSIGLLLSLPFIVKRLNNSKTQTK
jgi:hypothetical protein